MRKSFVKTYIIFLILLFIFFVLVLVIRNRNINTQANTSSQVTTIKNYEIKTDSQGTISVEVTPKILSKTDNSSFEVAINNHQVALNYDLAKIAVLTDDKGNKYSPISWNGPEGEHHSVGILVFSKLSNDTSSVSLFLPKIGGADRIFTWKL